MDRENVMAWIESHTALERHKKLIAFRRLMRWSKNEAIGFLHRFWWLVLQYAPNGDVAPLVKTGVLEEQLEMSSDNVANALKLMETDEINLLDRKGSRLLVHDWCDYAGRYLRDSLYRNHPERWQEVKELHGVSADDQPTNGVLPAVPTNNLTKRWVSEQTRKEKERKRKK